MVERKSRDETNHGNESILSQEFVATILYAAKENLKKDGSLSPVLFARFFDGEQSVFLLELPDTTKEKQAYFTTLGSSVRRSGRRLHEAVFVSEVWYLNETRNRRISLDMRPSEHPERKEAILIVGRNADRTCLIYLVQPFSRNRRNQPMFGPIEVEGYKAPPDRVHQPVGLIDYLFPRPRR